MPKGRGKSRALSKRKNLAYRAVKGYNILVFLYGGGKSLKDTIKRGWALLLVLVMVSAVCMLFSVRKQGMFIDELYTYGLSNSSYHPFLSTSGERYGSVDHAVITRQELLDYVTVNADEGFDFGSVYYNQVNDVHPPLYYWLFNIASTFAKGSFSKWTGLVLDWLIYLGSVSMLYALVRKLGGGKYNAAITAVLYGLSSIGLSTMIMIRMYVLLTLLTVVLMYFIADLMERFRPCTCVFVGLTLLAGLMTQYYFVFYAFFLCAAYVLRAFIKRQYKALAWFIPCALIGALSLLLVFPAALKHLFAEDLVSGGSAVDNLKNTAQYAIRLHAFAGFARHGLRAAVYTGLICIGGLCGIFPQVQRASFDRRFSWDWLVFLVPAYVTFVLVALISPVDEPRYIYNLMPAFVLTVSFLLYLLETTTGEKKISDAVRVLAFLAVSGLALWQARTVPPDNLFPEHAAYNETLKACADDPCVMFAEPKDAFMPLTEGLVQLLTFPEVYVTDQQSLDPMFDYVGDADNVVVYIDTSVFWSSGYDADALLKRIAEESDFDKAEKLFTTGLSTTYLISR